MPNWAFGYVNVTGTRDGIKSFIERFVSEDDPSTIPGKRFFARSFIQSKRQAFIDEAMKEFSEPAVDAKASYSFVASFAWSAYSCLIGGYPQNSPSECLTLSEACAEDGVSVMIQTSEPGICFEEHITCDDTDRTSAYMRRQSRFAACAVLSGYLRDKQPILCHDGLHE